MSFNEPQSTIEAILQNMLGADNEIVLTENPSRNELLLMAILETGIVPHSVEVEDAAAEIEAVENTIYRCGTLTSLTVSDIPETGMFVVIFTSGATPTSITWGDVVPPDGFTVEANTRYEVNVLDGYATIGSWGVS